MQVTSLIEHGRRVHVYSLCFDLCEPCYHFAPPFSLKISGERTCHPVTEPARDSMINPLNRKKRKPSLYHDVSVIR